MCEEIEVLKISKRKENEITGWRKFHNLYSSPNVFTVMKSRRMRLMERVIRMT